MVSIMINYCSNEQCFIDAMLTQCLIFSDDIVVSYGSHLYDGTPENLLHIYQLKLKYPGVKFVRYEVNKKLDLTQQKGVVNRPKAYWHNLARWVGSRALQEKRWVFVLDADEIPDGKMVGEWLSTNIPKLKEDECYKIANYWYFKSPKNQATTLEDSVLLIHYKYLTERNIFGDLERDHLIAASNCVLKRQVRASNNEVMFHHYSFVRPKTGLVHKLTSWGHSGDIFKNVDVGKMVDYIYKDDEVNDIVHGYKYKIVNNTFGIVIE